MKSYGILAYLIKFARIIGLTYSTNLTLKDEKNTFYYSSLWFAELE